MEDETKLPVNREEEIKKQRAELLAKAARLRAKKSEILTKKEVPVISPIIIEPAVVPTETTFAATSATPDTSSVIPSGRLITPAMPDRSPATTSAAPTPAPTMAPSSPARPITPEPMTSATPTPTHSPEPAPIIPPAVPAPDRTPIVPKRPSDSPVPPTVVKKPEDVTPPPAPVPKTPDTPPVPPTPPTPARTPKTPPSTPDTHAPKPKDDHEKRAAKKEAKENKEDWKKLKELIDRKRKEYFDAKNSKVPPDMAGEHGVLVQEKKEEYDNLKKFYVNELVGRGDDGKKEARNFLLGEVELNRKNDIDNKHLEGGERVMAALNKGVEAWDKFGTTPGWKGALQRTVKTGASLAMIGVTSGFAVQKLADIGIGTASALGGGLMSHLGQKVGMGTAISAITSLVPPEKLKWTSAVLLAAGAAGTLATGGIAAGGLVASSAIGLGLARVTKKYNEKIKNTMEAIGKGELNPDTIADDVERMEKEMAEGLRLAEGMRVKGKVLEGVRAFLGSTASLEIMGAVHDYNSQGSESKPEEVKKEDSQQAKTEKPGTNPEGQRQDQPNAPAAPKVDSAAQGTPSIKPDVTTGNVSGNSFDDLEKQSFSFDSGKGGAQGILDFKTQLREHYHNDFSNAPKSVQDFMNETNILKQAKEFGFFDPSNPNESAHIVEGSTLKFENGHLVFHDARTGEDIVHYEGKMFDSDHSGVKTNAVEAPVEKSAEFTGVIGSVDADPDNQNDGIGNDMTRSMEQQQKELELKNNILNKIDGQNVPQNIISTPNGVYPNQDKVNVLDVNSRGQRTIVGDSRVPVNDQFAIFKQPPVEVNIIRELGLPSEFNKNHYDLTLPEMKEVAEVYNETIAKLLPENTEENWNAVKGESARDFLRGEIKFSDTTFQNKMMAYIQTLQKTANLDPRGGYFRTEESLGQFITHALEKIKDDDNLAQVKLR